MIQWNRYKRYKTYDELTSTNVYILWFRSWKRALTVALALFMTTYLFFTHFSNSADVRISEFRNVPQEFKRPLEKVNHTTSLITRDLQCMPGLYIVILITSHSSEASGRKRRNTIRNTWGRYDVRRGIDDKKKWQTFFVVATRGMEENHKAELKQEKRTHEDIIEGDFEETFDNLPYKLQVGFEWVHLYCASSYVAKTDDDSFIFTKNMLMYLHPLSNKTLLWTGYIHYGKLPSRAVNVTTIKYDVSFEEWPDPTYPTFVSGATMLFSHDVISRLVGIMPHETAFKLEDVYIGKLMKKLGLKETLGCHIWEQKSLWMLDDYRLCTWTNKLIVRAFYRFRHECIYEMYNRTFVYDDTDSKYITYNP